MRYSTIEGCIRQTLGIPMETVTYSKVPFTRDTQSSHIGKWRIHYQNGDPITLDPGVEPENWPDYPVIVEDEEEAVIFSQSWNDWLSTRASLTS